MFFRKTHVHVLFDFYLLCQLNVFGDEGIFYRHIVELQNDIFYVSITGYLWDL